MVRTTSSGFVPIMRPIGVLAKLTKDVEKEWTFILYCPDGLSLFKPDGADDGSVIIIQDPAEDDPTGLENRSLYTSDGDYPVKPPPPAVELD